MEMRAVVLEGQVEQEVMRVRRVAVPEPPAGWVRVKVEAFGLNRSEYHLRAGLATNARFPVIPGIEATCEQSCRWERLSASSPGRSYRLDPSGVRGAP